MTGTVWQCHARYRNSFYWNYFPRVIELILVEMELIFHATLLIRVIITIFDHVSKRVSATASCKLRDIFSAFIGVICVSLVFILEQKS